MNISSLFKLYMGLGVLFFSGFFIFLFDVDNPTATYSILSAQFYFVSGIVLYKNINLASYYLFKSRYPILICILAFFSIVWSYNSGLALTRSIALLGTLFFALALVITLNEEELIKVLVYPLLFAAVIAVVVALLLPSIGVDDGSKVSEHGGLWQGTFGFKNRLGRVMGLLAVILLSQQVFSKNVTNFMLVITLFVLIMSGSSTPIIAVMFVMATKCYLSISYRINTYLKVAASIMIVFLLFFIPVLLELVVIDIMGKDLSGSGRVDMWIDILLSIDSPILGYGFGGGFWGEFGYANGLIDSRYVLLGHAHNGFVDTLIELGFVGAVFYFGLLIRSLVDSVKAVKTNGAFYLLSLFLVLFFIVYSISGSAYIKQNNILFVLACVASFLPYKRSL